MNVPPEPPTVGAERFCALVRYQGSFTTLAGPSPSPVGSNDISAGIDGSFEGGYLLVFNADELPSPEFSTRGHIGTFDGPIDLYDWRSLYFTKIGLDACSGGAGSTTAATTAPGSTRSKAIRATSSTERQRSARPSTTARGHDGGRWSRGIQSWPSR